MADVGGNDHAPARHFGSNGFRGEVLPLGHKLHLFRHHALARVMHLRHHRPGAILDPITPNWQAT